MQRKKKAHQVEEEIRQKQAKAQIAKQKGMHATYSSYLQDISILKSQLQRLRTTPLGSV